MATVKKNNNVTRRHIAFMLALVSFGLLLVGTGVGSAMIKNSRADIDNQIVDIPTPTPSFIPKL